MRTENELKSVSDALLNLQNQIGNSFDDFKQELEALKNEINTLKSLTQNFKQLSNKIQTQEK